MSTSLETLAADAYPRMVATLIRVTGDWTLAEDCAQEALAAAVQRWPLEGEPGNPGGWLMTVARNRAIDALRRASVERRKLAEAGALALTQVDDTVGEGEVVDDRLRLVFTCCHPALALESRVALTLRTICGVPAADIARAFLVTEPTMTRRLTRAKRKIADAGIPYRVPAGPALAERLPGVLAVLYLLFTQGYNADGRPAFAEEAIRLARLLRRLMPGQGEVSALLALFLLQHSRRAARQDAEGNLLPLDRQDRSRWDTVAIAEGLEALAEAERDSPYALQARIAACHAVAPSVPDTDWAEIARCYDALAGIRSTPVVELNRAVAHGYAYGPGAGLALLGRAQEGGALDGHPLALAAEADLTARQGDRDRAAALFRQAATAAHTESERRALLDRAAETERPAPLDCDTGIERQAPLDRAAETERQASPDPAAETERQASLDAAAGTERQARLGCDADNERQAPTDSATETTRQEPGS
ncbi:sigma-70 family RNA polymerase sigma factor [Nonomuraea sp. NPDC048882]|uniref:RNA polymerase sigma factor n=1 Tax=Nonomuraea sp. NPDC048882 TaxID=3154347 RepID=UPI0033E9F5E6